jgi:hypothetical protein
MTEARKTAIWMAVALPLALLTWVTAPRNRTPAILAERGELFFPQFRDPNEAASLEVIVYDPQSAEVHPFKVENRNGRWTIPSQHDYPADAKDRLATTAAAIIALKKDDVASDNAADYERCGVLDPIDTAAASTGRGTRLLVRGMREQVLADLILGAAVAGHPGFRYVRQTGQRRVYMSNVGDLQVSTAFGDWIERDLLQVNPDEINAVNLRNYALDRSTGQVNPGETLLLQKDSGDGWTINGLGANETLDIPALSELLKNIAGLTITGVLPKPPGITATLSHPANSASIAPADRSDLASKGFYLAPTGQLVSNRGEVVIRTTRGVFYTLRFGDIALGADAPAKPGTAARESRYLFIMADFDPQSAGTPGRAAEGAEKVQLLRARFAPWYYVIAADGFAKIRLQRSDLVKSKRIAPVRESH